MRATLSSLGQSKYKLRALFRSASFLCLIVGFVVYNNFQEDRGQRQLEQQLEENISVTFKNQHRFLNETNVHGGCDLEKADPAGMLVVYILGVLYCFLALAVVCDEFFVPALEEMSSDRRMGLSMDVAGATLMAAGGSAPELFTSLIGTFQESDIGFGTIVGSAVFNVLFVIAMCSFLSKEELTLTWWPLFRDCVYYTFGLGVLAIFIGVVSKDRIELWEAIVLFVMYFGYVLLMKYHTKLHHWISAKVLGKTIEREDSLKSQEGSVEDGHIHFNRHSTFRAGILKLLSDPKSWANTAGVGIVAKISGDVGEVFAKIDVDKDGYLSREEIATLFQELHLSASEQEIDAVCKELDRNGDGKIDEDEFTVWYVKSEKRMLAKVKETFDLVDTDKSGGIDRQEVRKLINFLQPTANDASIEDALKDFFPEGQDEVTFDQFSEWYKKSLFYEDQKHEVESELEPILDSLKPPASSEGALSFVRWLVLLPLVLVFTLTIPDSRKPHLAKWCYLSFILSILWIGIFSYFMVGFTEIIGNTLGIPTVIMGLTFLAAGTSVPDLLSSVIVARMGEGDMAVSSSIGSNIFDILVGLPFPWIIYTAYHGKDSYIKIDSGGIGSSIVILLAMLVAIVLIIHFQGWKMTKKLGGLMLILYVVFLAQAIIREFPINMC